MGTQFFYTGELDSQGRACGYGKAKSKKHGSGTYQGSFYNDTAEGLQGEYIICVTNFYELVIKYASCSRMEGEMREGYWFGKRTLYNHM